MKPNQDSQDELSKELDGWALKHMIRVPVRAAEQGCVQELIDIINAHTQKAVTEARIDELSKALDVYNHLEEYNADPPQNLKPGNHYILDRIATLTKDKEGSGNG